MSFLKKLAGPIIGAAGSLLGGAIGAKGAGDAADISSQGSQAALAENGRQFDLSMLANLLLNMPTINQGNTARSALSAMLGLSTPGTNYKRFAAGLGGGGGNSDINDAFGMLRDPGSERIRPNRLMRTIENTPGFEFAKEQAMRGIMGNSRALGLGKSGAAVQQIGDTIGQGLAFPVFNSYLDRLAGLAGASSGSSSQLASNIGQLATNSGATNAGLIQNSADSRASGVLGKYGAYQGALNDIASVAGNYYGNRNKRGGSISDMIGANIGY